MKPENVRTDLNGLSEQEVAAYFRECAALGKIFFYTGTEANTLLLDQADWQIAGPFPKVSMGCTGGVKLGYQFNRLMLEQVKKSKDSPRRP